MKKLKILLLLICSLFGLQNVVQAQTAYFTENFENGLPGSKPTTETQATLSSGSWFVKGSYKGTACEGSNGLRFIKSENSYAITPVLNNGVVTLTYKNSRKSVRTLTFYATTKTDLAATTTADWIKIADITSTDTGCDADLYTVDFTKNPSIAAADIRRIKIVNETTSDNDIDVLTINAPPVITISSDTEVTAFKLPGQVGTTAIDYTNGTIKLNVANGTNLVGVVPSTFTLSTGATVNPLASAAQDFSNENPVVYTVTAQDGTTTKTWTVTVKSVASSEKEITAFKLADAQIGNASINSSTAQILATMPIGATLSGLAPQTLTISGAASISPAASAVQDFSSPVVYTVTAQDGSTKQWTVTVVTIDPNVTFTTYEAENADYTGKTDNQHSGFTGSGFIDFLATGENHITFTTCNQQAGAQTAKFRYSFAKDENRSAALYVNDVFVQNVDFPRTATFTDWTEAIVAVNLNAGVNKIKLTWDETDGPNLDRMALSGATCSSYTLTVNTTNGGTVAVTPVRANNSYFSGESVTLLAEEKPALKLDSWSGDITGATNPMSITMNNNKTVTANFKTISTYKVNVTTVGIGKVTLSPAGGEYPEGTEVTVTAESVMGSTFQGFSGDLSGTASPQTITVNANKNITATFTDNFNIDFKQVVGFASVTGDGFTGPTTGGGAVIAGRSNDVVYINGPSEFAKLCEILYKRIRYKYYSNNPLTIVLEAGTYTDVASNGFSVWGNHMLTIQEQENLTIIGRKNVVLNFGINIKRSSNIIIRNISFQDYYDDGINVGETETHHIWIDHCTVGHPTTRPSNTEHPDGGIDIKNGASYVTVSWTLYRNSWKTGLVGHSDSNGGTDNGRLKVTYFGNYFYNTNSRNPRVRFGEVHVLNNLTEGVSLYGIAASNNSSVYAEGNFYLNTRWPMYADRASADFKAVYGNNTDDAFTSKTGNKPATGLKQINNEYDDSGLPVITSQINAAMLNPGGRSVKFDELNPEGIFKPSNYYSYTALPASVVRVVVPIYAGADKIDWFPEQLPLDLIAFEAKKSGTPNNPQVTLAWTTTNEVNTDKFEVLRKGDTGTFEVIDTQLAKNTAGVHAYGFTDRSPLKGNNYYRLKQYDKDSKFTLSDLKLVKIEVLANVVSVFPNPTANWATINHEALAANTLITVVDLQGNKRLSVTAKKGDTSTKIDLTHLPSGLYLISLANGDKLQTLKVVKK